MSRYIKQKVLRIPIEKTGENKDIYSIENEYSELFGYDDLHKFQVAPTEADFVDYVLETNDDCFGEYGKVRKLSPSEQEKYSPIFKQLFPKCQMKDVHLVEFCWYNCSEAPDYYELGDFYDEV